VVFDHFSDLVLGILGTGKEILLHIGHIGQGFRIGCHFGYPDNLAYAEWTDDEARTIKRIHIYSSWW